MIEYKGYVAAVEFDDFVGCFHGRVINSAVIQSLLLKRLMLREFTKNSAGRLTSILFHAEKTGWNP